MPLREFYGDPTHAFTCSMATIDRYRRRITGPLLDRIDIHLDVQLESTTS